MAAEELRLSVRVDQETLDLIDQHQRSMAERIGASFTKTQAVMSLINVGFLAWQASERAGVLSPAVLISMGTDAAKGDRK